MSDEYETHDAFMKRMMKEDSVKKDWKYPPPETIDLELLNLLCS